MKCDQLFIGSIVLRFVLGYMGFRHFVERSMVSDYGTRNHRDLQIPKVRLEYANRGFYFYGAKSWNKIPDNIREQESFALFEKHLRE